MFSLSNIMKNTSIKNNSYNSDDESENLEIKCSNSHIPSHVFDINNNKHIRLVSLEGNIGAGKSTLMKKLKEIYQDDHRFIFLIEPVDQWEIIRDNNGKNMIQKYYENPIKYAFAFQIMAFQSRLQLLKETITYASSEVTTIVMERSLDADYNIFAKMLFEEGLMEDVEFEIYCNMALDILKEYSVDGIIWLDTDYEECFKRVEKRSRQGENKISLCYLDKCHQYHVEWLGADTGFVCRVNSSNIHELYKIDQYLCI